MRSQRHMENNVPSSKPSMRDEGHCWSMPEAEHMLVPSLCENSRVVIIYLFSLPLLFPFFHSKGNKITTVISIGTSKIINFLFVPNGKLF